MSIPILILCILFANGAMATQFISAGFSPASFPIMASGLLWLLAEWRGWRWFADIGLLSIVAPAAAGLWLGMPVTWMILSAVSGLAAWDLCHFRSRIQMAAPGDRPVWFERQHMAMLGGVLLLAAVLGLGALTLALRLQFWQILSVAIMTIAGMVQLVRWLQNQSQSR